MGNTHRKTETILTIAGISVLVGIIVTAISFFILSGQYPEMLTDPYGVLIFPATFGLMALLIGAFSALVTAIGLILVKVMRRKNDPDDLTDGGGPPDESDLPQ